MDASMQMIRGAGVLLALGTFLTPARMVADEEPSCGANAYTALAGQLSGYADVAKGRKTAAAHDAALHEQSAAVDIKCGDRRGERASRRNAAMEWWIAGRFAKAAQQMAKVIDIDQKLALHDRGTQHAKDRAAITMEQRYLVMIRQHRQPPPGAGPY